MMTRNLLLLSILLFPLSAKASDATITATASIAPEILFPLEQGRLKVEIVVPKGWHLWSLDPGPGPKALQITVGDTIALEGDWHGDQPEQKYDRGFEKKLYQYHGKVKLERLFMVAKGAQKGLEQLRLAIKGQICTEERCLDQRLSLAVPITIAKAATGATEPALSGSRLTIRGASSKRETPLDAKRKEGVLAYLIFAFLMGLAALATPCVFPAIPLTISFFDKYSKESFGRGARLAGVYALTMVAAYTFAGVVITILFSVSGLQDFAAHPIFNLALGGVLVFFSLNLLGLFEIQTPAFLVNWANALESRFGRGVGGSKQSGGFSDYLVVIVAALTATTVFFTCTVAFVGWVLAEAADGAWFWPTIGMLAFSTAFALPFFLLALFPQGAQRLQGASGNWLHATRVTLGFLELAAATKFVSNTDLVWRWGLLTRDVVLAFWVTLFALAGLYLIGKLRMGEGSAADDEGNVSVLQVMAGTLMFSLSLYLASALISSRPVGGWIDGWLPPMVYPGSASAPATKDNATFAWNHNLEEGRKKAKEADQLVFVNYTGYTCTNCRYMEGSVFPRPEIAALLQKMTLVELYTDGGTKQHEQNRADQVERFGTAALPFYSVECPDGQLIKSFPSSTNDPAEFRTFLEQAMEGSCEPEPSVLLETKRLDNNRSAVAAYKGKWTLINFWADWCGPCKVELKEFLAQVGARFEKAGHRFVTVAVEEEETVKKSKAFMEELKVAPRSALWFPSEAEGGIDPKLGFDGSLPYTVLLSPKGKVVWTHNRKIAKAELLAILKEHTGFDD